MVSLKNKNIPDRMNYLEHSLNSTLCPNIDSFVYFIFSMSNGAGRWLVG